MRRITALLLSTVLALSLLATAAPAQDAELVGGLFSPPCTEAPAPHQPTCNPYSADSGYAGPHANSYSQASVAEEGPSAPGDIQSVQQRFVPFVPLTNVFSPEYQDGGRVIWQTGIAPWSDSGFGKIDEVNGEVIDIYNVITEEQAFPDPTHPAITRSYGALDRHNRFFRTNYQSIEVMGDADPTDRLSPIALLKEIHLPASAMCRDDDGIVGLVVTYAGDIAFGTRNGMVDIIPNVVDLVERDTLDRLDSANIISHSINGDACDDPSVPREDLETTSNALSTDENGGIYPLTTDASYRFDFVDGQLQQTWRAEYQTGAASGGGVRIDQGSGSTPTLMGTAAEDDRFVVFTDGQAVMHVVLMWRDDIPADWVGLPGRDRRIACEYPIDFDDEDADATSSEQSVVVRGYGMYFPNNEMRNMGPDVLSQIPGSSDVIARIGSRQQLDQSPHHQPYGFERIDWDSSTRTCQTAWVNNDISVPNGIPFVAADSETGVAETVYGISAENGQNGLVAMDAQTGEKLFFESAGPLPITNGFYTGISIDHRGDVWTGGTFGYTRYRTGALTDYLPGV